MSSLSWFFSRLNFSVYIFSSAETRETLSLAKYFQIAKPFAVIGCTSIPREISNWTSFISRPKPANEQLFLEAEAGLLLPDPIRGHRGPRGSALDGPPLCPEARKKPGRNSGHRDAGSHRPSSSERHGRGEPPQRSPQIYSHWSSR